MKHDPQPRPWPTTPEAAIDFLERQQRRVRDMDDATLRRTALDDESPLSGLAEDELFERHMRGLRRG
jgi:hypothetical protein